MVVVVVVACGSVQVKFLLGGMEGLRSFMVVLLEQRSSELEMCNGMIDADGDSMLMFPWIVLQRWLML